jgi:hypothetical protein
MKQWFCTLMTLGLFLGMAGQSKGQPTYCFSTLDVPGTSFPNGASANGINALGQIVGYYADAGGIHSFLATPVP